MDKKTTQSQKITVIFAKVSKLDQPSENLIKLYAPVSQRSFGIWNIPWNIPKNIGFFGIWNIPKIKRYNDF